MSAFRRLARVTQVVSEEGEGVVFHNRLTHSLKVAQCARRWAEAKQPMMKEWGREYELDPDAVEAAALAHDLGHPPFGHTAEVALDGLAREAGLEGFEGNAQSLRIVTRLAFRSLDHEGLNLTRATLRGLLKYPWLQVDAPPENGNKWGAYESEAEVLAFAVDTSLPANGRKTLSAEVMDWSDDVTYATHDVDDFFRAGVIPLDRLTRDGEERAAFVKDFVDKTITNEQDRPAEIEASQRRLERILEFVGIERPFDGSREHRAILNRATSFFLGRYLFQLEHGIENDRLVTALSPEIRREVDLLKHLTWFYVIERPSLATLRHGQTTLIRNLFRTFERASRRTSSWSIFPPRVREQLERAFENGGAEDEGRVRAVIDFIAGLTEAQATRLHRKLCGLEWDPLFSKGSGA